MMKRILITGCNGQLGRSLQRQIALTGGEVECVATDVDTLDLTDAKAVDAALAQGRFDFVVNCAAYTAVDKAEAQPEICRVVNVNAVENIARAAAAHSVKVIHISTDYVFSGENFRPYLPTDATAPRSLYGSTKLEGEQALRSLLPEDAVIIRTAWLYSEYGSNFVKTMIRLGREKSSLKVVADQIGTPTYAGDLADAIIKVVLAPGWKPGVYHFTDEGVASWYDFTLAIHELSGITTCKVEPCTTEEYPTAACRPHYSVLSKAAIKAAYGVEVPHWRVPLAHCIKTLIDNEL